MLFYETSAKTGTNVEKGFFELTSEMSKRDYGMDPDSHENSYFDTSTNSAQEGSCCANS